MKRILFLFMMAAAFPTRAQAAVHVVSKSHTATKKKTVVKKADPPKVQNHKLPLAIFLKLIDSTEYFVVNHATEFQHVDLPRKNFDMFNSYIKDSVATEVPGLKSLIYYNYTMKSGQIIIGDIFWSDTVSYIVFKIYDKKYVNYYSRDGVEQLRSLFKL